MASFGCPPLELFFDLVFVFTITQLSALVEEHLSLLGVVRAGLGFLVMYWMYSGYAWLTNQVPPATTDRRLLLVCGMAAFLICALAIPHAFDRTALAFSLGYVLVVLVHSGLYAQAHGATVWRFVPLNLLGAACHIAAPLSPEHAILLGLGTALYLLGTAAFRLVFEIRPVATRLAAAAIAAATALAGGAVSALVQVGLLIATVIGVLAVESKASVRSAGGATQVRGA
jgi:low temperature requirement protein LtrA